MSTWIIGKQFYHSDIQDYFPSGLRLMAVIRIHLIIDCEAREIMHLVVSVRLSVRLCALSRLNRLTDDLHLLHGGRP